MRTSPQGHPLHPSGDWRRRHLFKTLPPKKNKPKQKQQKFVYLRDAFCPALDDDLATLTAVSRGLGGCGWRVGFGVGGVGRRRRLAGGGGGGQRRGRRNSSTGL